MSSQSNFTPDCLYEPIEGVERLERYRPGGYHPVAIGDRFHGRYRVVHKLGHGSYSTTWLAFDEQAKQYVAVKICTAESNPREIGILLSLAESRNSSKKRPSRTMIPSILDRFIMTGPNGTHQCYVTIPARSSLASAKDGSWIRLFQLDVVRALAAQVAIAVEQIHHHGIVHGDLHLGNILLKAKRNFDQLSVTDLYEEYGAPEMEAVVSFNNQPLPSNVPTYGVAPIWLGKASEDVTLPEASILLTDFGEAFAPVYQQRHESHAPLVVRCPETRFEATKSLSFPSDIWSLACTIWSLIAQSSLFEGFLATEDDMTCEHVDALGILPHEWWNKWEARHLYFKEDGMPVGRSLYRSWDDRFEDSVQQAREESGMGRVTTEEKDALFAMLKSMLSFMPANRLTAKQVLESEWMIQWALPAYSKVQDN